MSNYFEITSILEDDFEHAQQSMLKMLSCEKNFLNDELCEYSINGSKNIRSALIFLVTKMLGNEIDEKQILLSNAVELVHNASLLHDDVIDKAKTRRGHASFNEKFDNSISVVEGDFLLAVAFECLSKINDKNIYEIFSNAMKMLCCGEIFQKSFINKISNMEQYIEKSRNKTAVLFEAAVKSSAILGGTKADLSEFARNFGIAFQIKDDYKNIYIDGLSSDIEDRIFNAPVIFAENDYPKISEYNYIEIMQILKNDKYRELTKNLIKKYVDLAIENIKYLNDNKFKEILINLCKFLEVE